LSLLTRACALLVLQPAGAVIGTPLMESVHSAG